MKKKKKNIQSHTFGAIEEFYAAPGASTEIFGMDPTMYEETHRQRYENMIEIFKLLEIKNSTICDFGCGPGYILNRLDKSNTIIGADGYDFKDRPFKFYKFDFDYESFAEKMDESDIDYAICFETIEHLSNPYNFLLEIKKILKVSGLLLLSIPHEHMEHNTFYPGLLYPVENFVVFLRQMAFKHEGHLTIPSKFGLINLFILRNLPFEEHVQMRWENPENKAKKMIGQPPHVQINL